jgi:hypothetical protein
MSFDGLFRRERPNKTLQRTQRLQRIGRSILLWLAEQECSGVTRYA